MKSGDLLYSTDRDSSLIFSIYCGEKDGSIFEAVYSKYYKGKETHCFMERKPKGYISLWTQAYWLGSGEKDRIIGNLYELDLTLRTRLLQMLSSEDRLLEI
mgnify:CR=1 FL=1